MSALFSRETIDFLAENRMRNDKIWFNENKDRYERHVIAPFVALTEALAPTLKKIDGELVISPKVGGSISRIWRDARFSRDKSIFRDMMWCMFVRRKNESLPEFFFVVSPEGMLYGAGYYSAGEASMESIRGLILAGDGSFKYALVAYEKQNVFRLDGDIYKKSHFPDQPEKLREWLDRKSVCFLCNSSDFELLYSDGLAKTVAEGFASLAPIYRFLIRAEEVKFQ